MGIFFTKIARLKRVVILKCWPVSPLPTTAVAQSMKHQPNLWNLPVLLTPPTCGISIDFFWWGIFHEYDTLRHWKNSMTLYITASMTLYVTAKFCMTLCVTSSISLKIGCMTQKCMTQNVRPKKAYDTKWTTYRLRLLEISCLIIYLWVKVCWK